MSKNIDPGYITPDDLLYIRDRESLRQEFILQGFGDPLAADYPGLVDKDGNFLDGVGPDSTDDSEGSSPPADAPDGHPVNVQEHLPEDQRWDDQNKSDELHAVIEARNAGRDEDAQIAPVGTGQDGNLKKVDLQDALRADDLAIAEYIAEHPDEFQSE